MVAMEYRPLWVHRYVLSNYWHCHLSDHLKQSYNFSNHQIGSKCADKLVPSVKATSLKNLLLTTRFHRVIVGEATANWLLSSLNCVDWLVYVMAVHRYTSKYRLGLCLRYVD